MDNKETHIRDNILDALRVVLLGYFQEVLLASWLISERFVLDGGKAIGPNVASVYRDSGVHFRHYLYL